MTEIVTVDSSTPVEILTGVRQIGAALGVGKNVAHRMVRRGTVPAALDGGRWRVARSAIAPWLAVVAASKHSHAALAEALLRRSNAPRGGGVVPGPRPVAGGSSRDKTQGGKAGFATEIPQQNQGSAEQGTPAVHVVNHAASIDNPGGG